MSRLKAVEVKERLLKFRPTPLVTGFILGLWIAIAQAFIGVKPPSVYGFCFLGHPTDLENWSLNHLLGMSLPLHPISVELPVLTVLGVLAGSMIAAKRHGELKWRPGKDWRDFFTLGFAVASTGLLLGHCPIMVSAATVYGDLILATGLAFIGIGVALGVRYLRWRAKR